MYSVYTYGLSFLTSMPKRHLCSKSRPKKERERMYTMNFDPATSTLTLDLLATTGFGCVMVYLGKGIVRRVKVFQDWSLSGSGYRRPNCGRHPQHFKEQRHFLRAVDLHARKSPDEYLLYLCRLRLQPEAVRPRQKISVPELRCLSCFWYFFRVFSVS